VDGEEVRLLQNFSHGVEGQAVADGHKRLVIVPDHLHPEELGHDTQLASNVTVPDDTEGLAPNLEAVGCFLKKCLPQDQRQEKGGEKDLTQYLLPVAGEHLPAPVSQLPSKQNDLAHRELGCKTTRHDHRRPNKQGNEEEDR